MWSPGDAASTAAWIVVKSVLHFWSPAWPTVRFFAAAGVAAMANAATAKLATVHRRVMRQSFPPRGVRRAPRRSLVRASMARGDAIPTRDERQGAKSSVHWSSVSALLDRRELAEQLALAAVLGEADHDDPARLYAGHHALPERRLYDLLSHPQLP